MRKRGLILKSTLFFILKAIQNIVVIESGAKPVITPTHLLILLDPKRYDILN